MLCRHVAENLEAILDLQSSLYRVWNCTKETWHNTLSRKSNILFISLHRPIVYQNGSNKPAPQIIQSARLSVQSSQLGSPHSLARKRVLPSLPPSLDKKVLQFFKQPTLSNPSYMALSVQYRARIFKQSIGARNRGGIGLSYRPARRNSFLGIDSWAP